MSGTGLSLALSARRSESFLLDLELEVPPGVTVLFGPSGSGKSTVLACAAGLLRPDRGRVALSGKTLFDSSVSVSLPPHERGIALVSQEGLLFPHLSVLSNLRYGEPRALRKPGALEEDEVVAALELGAFLSRRPRELSGGERQRVALGRALLSGPDALLLDEPLASLDRERRARIVPYLERVKSRCLVPILYVTHALDEALALGERACVLCEGKKIAEGTPLQVFGSPGKGLVARLSGFENVLEVTVVDHDEEDRTTLARLGERLVHLPRVAREPGERALYGLLAADIVLATEAPSKISARNVLPGKVASLERGEEGLEARIRLDGEPPVELAASILPSSAKELGLAPGSSVFVVIKSTAPHPLVLSPEKEGGK